MLASLGNITRSWKGVVLSLMWLLNRNRRSSYMRCPCSRLSCGSCTHLLVSNTFTLCLHLGRGTAGDTLIWHSLYHPLAQAGIGDSPLCWGSWGEDGDYFRLNNWGTAAETESLRAAEIIRLTVHLPPTSFPDFSLPSPKSSGLGHRLLGCDSQASGRLTGSVILFSGTLAWFMSLCIYKMIHSHQPGTRTENMSTACGLDAVLSIFVGFLISVRLILFHSLFSL